MSADLLQAGWSVCIALTLALGVILIQRIFLYRLTDGRLVYLSWWTLPLSAIALFFPPPRTILPDIVAPVSSGLNNATVISAPAFDSPVYPAVIITGWLSISLLLLCISIYQQRHFIKRLGRLHPVAEFFVSERSDISPALVGLIHPRIVMPSDFFERYSTSQQDLILSHEQVHQQRLDLWANAAFWCLRCIFWFHPLVYIAHHYFRLDQELACDAEVLRRHPAQQSNYAQAMLHTALQQQAHSIYCSWQHHHPLKERIMQLKKAGKAQHKLPSLLLILCTALTGTVSAWASHNTQVTSMQDAAPVSLNSMERQHYRIQTRIVTEDSIVSPAIIAVQGETTSLELADGKNTWKLVLRVDSPEAMMGEKYQQLSKEKQEQFSSARAAYTKLEIYKNDRLLATPSLISQLGQQSRIESSSDQKENDIAIDYSIVKTK